MKTILITGAAGDVGTHLRRELAGKYVLRVSDLRSLTKLNKEERFTRADISQMADALRITKGVDAVVHLGGYSVEGPWDAILSANIVGCYNVFEAAHKNGVKRFIFATSNHATGFYRRDETIDTASIRTRRPLWRVHARRSARQSVCRQIRDGRFLHTHRQCKSGAH
jgi:uronate dehydrogenase